MKIVCIMPVRNEAWCLGLTARAVMLWADELVILDHASTDVSPDIAVEIANLYEGRVTVVRDDNPEWQEMRHRQALLELARVREATHIATIDADELVTSTIIRGMRDFFRSTPKGTVLQLPWLQLRGSLLKVHTSGPWADGQMVSSGFVDAPELHWSSAGRGGYDFHHRHPMGRACVPYWPAQNRTHGGVMHLQMVSGRRLRAKQALYKMTEVLRWPGREPVRAVDERYNLAVYGRYQRTNPSELCKPEGTLETTPKGWWQEYIARDWLEFLDLHMAPWQEAECLRLLDMYGPKPFADLDLFGIGETEGARRA